jgi:WD40 repeat protein
VIPVSQAERVTNLDGKYVATASWDKTARLWMFNNTEDLIKESCNRLTRNLAPEEWKRYMGGEPYHNTLNFSNRLQI